MASKEDQIVIDIIARVSTEGVDKLESAFGGGIDNLTKSIGGVDGLLKKADSSAQSLNKTLSQTGASLNKAVSLKKAGEEAAKSQIEKAAATVGRDSKTGRFTKLEMFGPPELVGPRQPKKPPVPPPSDRARFDATMARFQDASDKHIERITKQAQGLKATEEENAASLERASKSLTSAGRSAITPEQFKANNKKFNEISEKQAEERFIGPKLPKPPELPKPQDRARFDAVMQRFEAASEKHIADLPRQIKEAEENNKKSVEKAAKSLERAGRSEVTSDEFIEANEQFAKKTEEERKQRNEEKIKQAEEAFRQDQEALRKETASRRGGRRPPPEGPLQGPDLSGELRRRDAELRAIEKARRQPPPPVQGPPAPPRQPPGQPPVQGPPRPPIPVELPPSSVKSMGDAINTAMTKSAGTFQKMMEGVARANVPRPPPRPGAEDFIGPVEPRRPRRQRGGDGDDGGRRGGGNLFGMGAQGQFDSLKDAFNALRPAALAAGLSFSQLTPYLVAAQAGAVGLTAALVGGLIVALENAGNAATKAAKRLGNVMGDTDQGKKAFEDLQKLAPKLGTTATALAEPFEQFIRLNQKRNLGLKTEDMEGILETVVKGLQAEDVPTPEALNFVKELVTEINQLGGVSADTVKKLDTLAPKLGETFAKTVQKIAPGELEAGLVTAPAAIKTLQDPGLKRQVDADAAAAETQSKSIGQAFEKLTASAHNLLESLSGGHVIGDALDAAAKLLDELRKKIDELKLSENQRAGIVGGAITGAITGAAVGFASPIPGGLIGGGLIGAGIGAAGGGAVATGAEKVIPELRPPPALKEMAPGIDKSLKDLETSSAGAAKSVGGLGRAADQAGKLQKEIGAQSASLNKRKAKLDLDFIDREQAVQEKQQVLAVKRADQAVEAARIGVQEADKQKKLAALAPEQARLATDSARSQLEGIQLQQMENRMRKEGIDPEQDSLFQQRKQQLQDQQLDDAERQAKLGLKRAKIEESFAHLEPRKAQLAGEQAETALRSAELEKEMSELTLAKDKQGRPIDRDLAQVRYAQASLDEFKALNETATKQLTALESILEAVGGLGKGGGSSRETRTDKEGKPVPPDQPLKPGDTGTVTDERTGGRQTFRVDEKGEKVDTTGATTSIPGPGQALSARQRSIMEKILGQPTAEPAKPTDEPIKVEPVTGTTPPLKVEPVAPTTLPPVTIPEPAKEPFFKSLTPAPQEERRDQPIQPQPREPMPTGPPLTPEDVRPKISEAPTIDTGPATQSATQLATAMDTAKTATEGVAPSVDTMKTAMDGVGTSTETAKTGLDGVGTSSGTSATSIASLAPAADAAAQALSSVRAPDTSGSGKDKGGGGATASAATGGLIRGPGTGTSDSIHARLSHGEFVVRAKAVEHFGPSLFHALNNFRLPKLNIGGLMSPSIPRFAEGGLVDAGDGKPSSAPPHLGTVDLRTDHGSAQVMASSTAAAQLQKLAVQKRITSTGRKPGFIG